MIEVVVTGIGLRSSLGDLEQSWHRLCQSQTAIALHRLFPELPTLPLALIGSTPQQLRPLVQIIVQDALDMAGLQSPLPDCGIAIGSSRGCQGELEFLRQHPEQLSVWPERLLATATNIAARQIQTHGPVAAPMAACATSLWAIAQGYWWLQQGQCQQVLVGAVETPITPLTLASFKRMGALATTGCYPFDRDREGLVLGEGGAVFLLETAQSAQQRQAPLYGRVRGVSLNSDAYHVSAPDPQGKMANRMVHNCLARSQLSPADIDYIHAHGTSTQRNDRQESQLITQVWGDGTVPVSSTKGATGHTLGASGALGLAFSLLALRDQQIPPCVGLRSLEFPLNCVHQAKAASIRNCLILSFGFGGQNAALAISQVTCD
ncbi:MAG: beta-ketoacyl-ACP synthase [Spirulina sp. SIO3F2]|nr:beta-ketoacyl-ACP synthase [Spirulina sp. SIO3F2]